MESYGVCVSARQTDRRAGSPPLHLSRNPHKNSISRHLTRTFPCEPRCGEISERENNCTKPAQPSPAQPSPAQPGALESELSLKLIVSVSDAWDAGTVLLAM